MRGDAQRLADILEAADKITEVSRLGRYAFDEDERNQVWIVHYIQIIGEAARSLSEALKIRYSDVPWKNIIAMRHVLVHGYFGIDLNEVWRVVERDLPELRRSIQEILTAESAASDSAS